MIVVVVYKGITIDALWVQVITFRSTMTTLQECRKHEGFLSSKPISAFIAAQAPPLNSSSSVWEPEPCKPSQMVYTLTNTYSYCARPSWKISGFYPLCLFTVLRWSPLQSDCAKLHFTLQPGTLKCLVWKVQHPHKAPDVLQIENTLECLGNQTQLQVMSEISKHIVITM